MRFWKVWGGKKLKNDGRRQLLFLKNRNHFNWRSVNCMPKLKPISWKKFESFLFYAGCRYERKRGDHRIYGRNDLKRPVVFPEDKEFRFL